MTRSSISTRSKPRSLRRSVERTSFGPAVPAGAAPKNSSSVPPYADATRWSSETDGSARPRSTRLRYDAEIPARSAALRSDRLRLVRAARSRLPDHRVVGYGLSGDERMQCGRRETTRQQSADVTQPDDVLGRIARWRPPARIGRTSPLRSHALSVDGLTPTRRATSPMRMSSTRTHSSTRRGCRQQVRCPTRSNLSLLSRL